MSSCSRQKARGLAPLLWIKLTKGRSRTGGGNFPALRKLISRGHTVCSK